MSDSMHTPGPWLASGGDRVVSETLLFCGDVAPAAGQYRGDIATIQSANHIGSHGIGRKEAAANALLIAAAPDLLEALERMAATFSPHPREDIEGWREECEAVDLARAAIAKATQP